ncbi:hypothetical protein FHT02_000532 [Sphingomonas xinjiangensis]|uniref:Uncharacterized protein n=1 Tax=Sphingomonas xinjiangensis TaxID=643568 RepID=A0A840YJY9_9SPHN|nr:hypothetical protein [Sphingomonas xinjiangensis]
MATGSLQQGNEPVYGGKALRGVLIGSALAVPFWVVSGALLLKALVQ